MKWSLVMFVVGLLGSSDSMAQAKMTLYDLVSRAKRCQANELNGSIDCEYKVGKDLHIAIAAVGETTTGISFFRSNMDGDFYGSVGVQHGCVVVKSGAKSPKEISPLDFAFISPRNGKVYRTWMECKAAG